MKIQKEDLKHLHIECDNPIHRDEYHFPRMAFRGFTTFQGNAIYVCSRCKRKRKFAINLWGNKINEV